VRGAGEARGFKGRNAARIAHTSWVAPNLMGMRA
jgi:hypothetical protein